MARLHEHQGKGLLRERGVEAPEGGVARSGAQAERIARELGGRVIVKIQAWTTGRAAMGGVAFAENAEEAGRVAERLLKLKVGAFAVDEVLVERVIAIKDELFVSLTIDDAARAPTVLVSLAGGSGVEERGGDVHRVSAAADGTIDTESLRRLIEGSSLEQRFHEKIVEAISAIGRTARDIEARSLEVNPLVTTEDGRVMAADCRMTVDDYAVFRHPELGIDIARELDHPPTTLERIAYHIEQADHRGTFYFARLPVGEGDRAIGFHGAGGGGSMMSMDAVSAAGFTPANFTDTSGNPSAAKVYAAARIILAQEGIVGYFGSGSGVASQEQYHSAYGLAKALRELEASIPVVIRLGGNSEDRAVAILEDACRDLPGEVRGFKKDDTPAYCAEVFAKLIERNGDAPWRLRERRVPGFVGSAAAMSFPIRFGGDAGASVWIDIERCTAEVTDLIVKHSGKVLKNEDGKPALAVDEETAARKDSELIACEIECARAGHEVVFVDLPIAGIDGPARTGIAAATEGGAAGTEGAV